MNKTYIKYMEFPLKSFVGSEDIHEKRPEVITAGYWVHGEFSTFVSQNASIVKSLLEWETGCGVYGTVLSSQLYY